MVKQRRIAINIYFTSTAASVGYQASKSKYIVFFCSKGWNEGERVAHFFKEKDDHDEPDQHTAVRAWLPP